MTENKLVWTNEFPKVDGFYWMRWSFRSPDLTDPMKEIVRVVGTDLWLAGDGRDSSGWSQRFDRWFYGPLEAPDDETT